MPALLTIGRFSRLAHISVSALRFYADAGLLVPALVDPASGYRYYAPEQLALARQISELRAVEMPLDEIAALLRADEAGASILLAAHEERLYERFQAQRRALQRMDQLLRHRHPLPDLDVRERAWPEQPLLSVRGSASAEDYHAFWQAARAELQAVLERAGLEASGLGFELYHAAEYLGGPLDVEVCLPVARPLAGAGRVRFGVLPPQRAACALHRGDWRSFGASYAAIHHWLSARPAGVWSLLHPLAVRPTDRTRRSAGLSRRPYRPEGSGEVLLCPWTSPAPPP